MRTRAVLEDRRNRALVTVILVGALAVSFSTILVLRSADGRLSSEPVIEAALQAGAIGRSVYPTSEGKRSCLIAAKRRLVLPCQTRVRFHHDGSATVSFTHWIDGAPRTAV
jgi:hypothetical protein